jgi:predicted nucleic acid-binding protein
VTCLEILDELTDKLQSKLSFTLEEAVDTLADLLTFLRAVPIIGSVKAVPADPDDDKIVECAVVASASHIVTGDRRHLLPIKQYQGILIIAPADFLAIAAAFSRQSP